MKQVISIADFATLLDILNDKIQHVELQALDFYDRDEEVVKKVQKENMERLKNNPFYKSLIHAKKALEECKVEIEVPDLEVCK